MALSKHHLGVSTRRRKVTHERAFPRPFIKIPCLSIPVDERSDSHSWMNETRHLFNNWHLLRPRILFLPRPISGFPIVHSIYRMTARKIVASFSLHSLRIGFVTSVDVTVSLHVGNRGWRHWAKPVNRWIAFLIRVKTLWWSVKCIEKWVSSRFSAFTFRRSCMIYINLMEERNIGAKFRFGTTWKCMEKRDFFFYINIIQIIQLFVWS